MNRKLTILLSAAVLAAAAFTGVAVAGGIADDDEPITGEALDRASAAALDHLGEGEVTDTEVGDEDSYYEVEVTLPDGREVDVQLDEDFTVVGEEFEDADEDDDDDEDEDDAEDDDAGIDDGDDADEDGPADE